MEWMLLINMEFHDINIHIVICVCVLFNNVKVGQSVPYTHVYRNVNIYIYKVWKPTASCLENCHTTIPGQWTTKLRVPKNKQSNVHKLATQWIGANSPNLHARFARTCTSDRSLPHPLLRNHPWRVWALGGKNAPGCQLKPEWPKRWEFSLNSSPGHRQRSLS